ncbi:hypothetical protein GEMRC1_008096 [Eukaryota sp. GEM-RC1]
MGCDSDLKSRIQLEDFAFKCLKYKLDDDTPDLSESELVFLSDDYKRSAISAMDTENLVELIISQPMVTLSKSDINTEVVADSTTFKPLGNLVFCRDQQITTAAGVVMMRLNSSQRANEIAVMKFCLEKLGVNPLGSVEEPGTLEGGDFFPLGRETCFIGLGLRSNMTAVEQLMRNNWFGTRRVCVVRDEFDQSQDRMHLDCVFNIVSDRICVCLDSIKGEDSPRRRLVDVYERRDSHQKYVKTVSDVEFTKFLEQEGWEIIYVTDQEQANYGCNHLLLGDSNIVCVNESVARKIARHPLFDGKISLIDFTAIQAMYGSSHCGSQVLFRRPRSQ